MAGPCITSGQVERLAEVAGLHIDPAHLPGVAHNLGILLMQAALFLDSPVDPLVEPAPVFRP
ncbi:MAG TPA: DUF4089 domain-containing protein [Candidatus Polarisedimenticolia bacterium]|jgi:hypothetical protein|nr:DUF4089 domain-containing protein [Candidatus Polarisedimenticolia bacterium]